MAHLGHDVKAFDVDSAKVAMLSDGRPAFYEPNFDELLTSTLATGRLQFTDSARVAIRGAEVHFICVGTPQQQGTDAADISHVEAAFDAIMTNADCAGVIVGKSTVPVGTAERLARAAEHRCGDHTAGPRLEVAWNPEFLREGTAIADTLHPDRLVLGVTSEAAEKALLNVYADLVESGIPYISTDLATSEMVKVAANSFLATKISFINAMAEICELANADVLTLSRALGYDDRIGTKFLNAGLGFGGGCLPKDIRAFGARAGELGAPDALSFLREIDKINMRQRERVISLAGTLLSGEFLSKNIAVLGAAFKPNSDDVRDSPALNVAAAMHLKGAAVRVHDPQAMDNAKKLFPTLTYCAAVEDACRDADLIVLATEWAEYRRIDPDAFRSVVRRPVLLDARNALDHDFWSESGWQVYALGRGNLNRDTAIAADLLQATGRHARNGR
jgi:UDPglucose 6-dehydrogenase